MMQEIPVKKVALLPDTFWSSRLKTNADHAIFHQWEMLEASGCIDNFRILLGEKEGFREGWFFADSDAYKWLDAAARINPPDPQLNLLMDGLIDLIHRAQSPDGYIFTYNQIHFPGTRWVNLQIEHELYCHGHLIEAGVSHHLSTGQDSLLSCARLAADLLVRDFLHAGPDRTPGHEEIEIALLRLHQVTRHQPYADLARQFIEQRGRTPLFALSILRQNNIHEQRKNIIQQQRAVYAAAHPAYAVSRLPAGNHAKMPRFARQRFLWSGLTGKYLQQHAPIRQQTIPEGHAVRFGYFQTAAAMLNRLQPDPTLLAAMEQAWENMVTRRMYVTGGIGSQPSTEGFGRDYELDPELAYNETCAALASQFWSWELALTTGKAQYSDLLEWQLYNASAVGMGVDGKSYLYNNPLEIHGGITRKAWYAVPCCPSNLSRTYASLGKYIYAADAQNVWVHQYISSQAAIDMEPPLTLQVESGLPWNGSVQIEISPAVPAAFTLHLRLPSWAGAAPKLRLTNAGKEIALPPLELPAHNKEPLQATAQGYDPRLSGFLPIRRTWQNGDRVELSFDSPIRLRRALPQVRGYAGKAAITRGALVYCLESIDQPEIDIFKIRLRPDSLRPAFHPELFGGTTLLHGESADGQPLTFIPYFLWGNRGASQMVVWVRT